jgi:hypothetical protein
MRFKRNQVEQAISGMYDPGSRAPGVELKTRLKRLLETDRDLGRNPRSTDPEQANYAFFSAKPPGSGVEVWFSGYEAFALYTGWRLLEHGWPQATAVSILRKARPRLEPKHAEILRWNPAKLFDEKQIRESAKPGTLATSTTRPVFLVIASRQGRPMERELMPFLLREAGLSATNFELVGAAHKLNHALRNTTPTKRGRGSN